MDNKTNGPQQYVVSSSPHAHSGDTVRKIMLTVIIAMLPALAASLYFFGLNALRLVLMCCSTCILTEAISRKIMGREAAVDDFSAVVTGMLLAFNLPPTIPSWMAVVGSAFAIIIVKQVFGGLGYNPFNPALAARVMLLIACTGSMTTWTMPGGSFMSVNAATTATPLGMWKEAWSSTATAPAGFFEQYPIMDLFLGNQPGCIGEVSALALLIGGLYLIWKRCIYWQVPVFYIGTVALLAGILYAIDPETNLRPDYHILTGGLMLGAFFMATDMVTSPITKKGMAVFGIGCGLLTMIIRKWSGGYPEGVSFAILFMNALVPLINNVTKPRTFGHLKAKK